MIKTNWMRTAVQAMSLTARSAGPFQVITLHAGSPLGVRVTTYFNHNLKESMWAKNLTTSTQRRQCESIKINLLLSSLDWRNDLLDRWDRCRGDRCDRDQCDRSRTEKNWPRRPNPWIKIWLIWSIWIDRINETKLTSWNRLNATESNRKNLSHATESMQIIADNMIDLNRLNQ